MSSQNKFSPPKIFLKCFRWFCHPDFVEDIEGDLLERFEKIAEEKSLRSAKWQFALDVIRLFRPGIIKSFVPTRQLNHISMIENYFKIAIRIMNRHRTFTTLNVFGLALGLTGAMLLFLWVQQEYSYDQFHVDKDRIYKAWNKSTENGQIRTWDATPRILAPTLKEEYSSIETAASIAQWRSKQLFVVGNKKLLKTSGAYTTADFLSIFSFPLIKGNDQTALNEPSSIVLTKSLAKQLFGEKEAFGETITLNESGYSFEFKVTGIMADLPSNTDFNFEYLIPFKFLESIGDKDTHWNNNSLSTYVKIKKEADIHTINKAIKDIQKSHSNQDDNAEVFLYPLSKMHLYSRFENGVQAGGKIEVIRMLVLLGIFMIAIACINFINLSTARAQRRAKEVAIRKVTGAFRNALVAQFLCESLLTTLIASVMAIAACYIALPYFNILIEQQLILNFTNPTFWLTTIGAIVIVGLLAGTYPAFVLSSFKPVKILKGSFKISLNKNLLRSTLVVLQFGFAVILIISAIVINRQINYVENRATGYDKTDLIYQPLTGDMGKNFLAYKDDLLKSDIAVSVTKTSSPITQRWGSTTDLQWEGKNPDEKYNIERFYMDDNFAVTAGLKIIKGRDMDLSTFPSDSTAVILNETAAEIMGFVDPIGEIIIDDGKNWTIIGVIKDFILTSPHQKIAPIILMGSKADWALKYVHIKLNPNGDSQKQLASLANLWDRYNPNFPFEYEYVDVDYQRKFIGIQKTQKITMIFTSLAIIIACLGLFGLSAFMTETRLKEIGIRKVFGGSVFGITKLLSFSSLKPIFIAIVVFSPMAWYSMNWWLSSFAYRIVFKFEIFIIAAACIIFIAILTTISQTLNAAKAKPIDTLRNE